MVIRNNSKVNNRKKKKNRKRKKERETKRKSKEKKRKMIITIIKTVMVATSLKIMPWAAGLIIGPLIAVSSALGLASTLKAEKVLTTNMYWLMGSAQFATVIFGLLFFLMLKGDFRAVDSRLIGLMDNRLQKYKSLKKLYMIRIKILGLKSLRAHGPEKLALMRKELRLRSKLSLLALNFMKNRDKFMTEILSQPITYLKKDYKFDIDFLEEQIQDIEDSRLVEEKMLDSLKPTREEVIYLDNVNFCRYFECLEYRKIKQSHDYSARFAARIYAEDLDIPEDFKKYVDEQQTIKYPYPVQLFDIEERDAEKYMALQKKLFMNEAVVDTIEKDIKEKYKVFQEKLKISVSK